MLKILKMDVRLTDREAEYDSKAKTLLSHKYILAWILVNTVDEFRDMRPNEAVLLIEGEPIVGIVPVDPGMTNMVVGKDQDGNKIVGLNTENSENNEGMIRFDILFRVRMKDGLAQIIMNVEPQMKNPSGYDLMNRAVFNACRMVSSQKERDFVNSNFDDIKRTVSVWICMNMKDDSLSYVHLTKDVLFGTYPWKGGLDLLRIVMVGLAKNLPERKEGHELHRLLGALLTNKLSVEERLTILEQDYGVPMDDQYKEEVRTVGNLGQGLYEVAWDEAWDEAWGEAWGEAWDASKNETIMNMHVKGYTDNQIAEVVKKDKQEVNAIIKRMSTAAV